MNSVLCRLIIFAMVLGAAVPARCQYPIVESICPGGICPINRGPQVPPALASPPGAGSRAGGPEVPLLSDQILAAAVRVWSGQSAGGSGAVIVKQDSTALVITCAHVFEDSTSDVTVVFRNGETCRGTLLAAEREIDLAAVEIPAPAVAPIKLCISRPVPDEPLACSGYGSKGVFGVTRGPLVAFVHLSSMPYLTAPDSLAVRASARNGDSGGPIFNARHELVGLVSASGGKTTFGPHCLAIRDFLRRRCPRYADPPQSIAPPANGQPGPVAPPAPGPAPTQPAPAAPATDPVADKLTAAFEVEKQKLIAAAEARLQAETKKLRQQVREQLGINKDLQATIGKGAVELEAKTAEALKHSNLAKSLQSKIAGLVSESAGKDTALAALESKLAAAVPQLAKLKALLAAGGAVPTGLTGLLLSAIPALGAGPASWLAWGISALGFFGLGKIKLRLPKKLLSGAAMGAAATLGTANNQPSAGGELIGAIKKAAADAIATIQPGPGQPAAPASAPVQSYGPTYNLSSAYADDLAAKRAEQGMTLGQQGLLAQIQQEAMLKLGNGDFSADAKAGEASLKTAMEHWIMGQFLTKHGVRTTLDPTSQGVI